MKRVFTFFAVLSFCVSSFAQENVAMQAQSQNFAFTFFDKVAQKEEKNVCFLFRGTDGEGRSLRFGGLKPGNGAFGLTFSSYTDMKNQLDASRMSHVMARLSGVDLIFACTDDAVMGMLLTKNGDLCLLLFGPEKDSLYEIRQSEKLMNDLAFIWHSMHPLDGSAWQCFDEEIWK